MCTNGNKGGKETPQIQHTDITQQIKDDKEKIKDKNFTNNFSKTIDAYKKLQNSCKL